MNIRRPVSGALDLERGTICFAWAYEMEAGRGGETLECWDAGRRATLDSSSRFRCFGDLVGEAWVALHVGHLDVRLLPGGAKPGARRLGIDSCIENDACLYARMQSRGTVMR